jgi:Lar family restriction alleviation protein
MSEELKACPFCGGDGNVETTIPIRHSHTGNTEINIGCWTSGCAGRKHSIYVETEAEAIKAWNRRKP